MNCCLPGLDLAKLANKLRDGARLMVGQGDYDAYVAHMRDKHDERRMMTREEFFLERQASRFGEGGRRALRCC
ncbi:YbdD/YjiX family protein [Methylocystis sp. Sn-Cys]|uniref:YbdD/YjiX family protein n=1 Tax=Methylocystis sp. Sn-Cys TaxID=1701263 RepID=UPI0019204F7F|nr:YbdD/YjiX family protein [Methylocystis sp. Sn-Cys]MBL1255385.1 YbdD/YjiX family protein [Methylocystis sp. Sn-Cys]